MATLPPSGMIERGVHRLPARVYFEDTDTAGIMYHAKYLHFLERGRTEYLRVAGIDHGAAVRDGLGAYAVTEMAIKWRRPARLDDVLTIETRLLGVRAATCQLAQSIRRGDELLAEATVTAAFLDPAGRPRRQPAPWLARFAELLQQDA
ncbi:YbgC/FadM family acyl-CoA thioesterase [Sandarakinorhabdus rubra]|uniref:YbgC/FadM family acyl-CoA thioesterase n=1 Tax=Sandarakinorhabdus rubra TaxID=2672568 RepID=UPI0013DCD831|nr:YbgC/FadM family acyl-CoA thioesterase [Sandarakinorhabdus rubra]